MNRLSFAAFGVVVAVLVTGGLGCEIVASVDRSKIDEGPGGSGGTGGMGGGGGMGGAGGTACMSPADCGGAPNECVEVTCEAGQCGTAPKAAGTPVADPTPGDCSARECDGDGAEMDVVDDEDRPVDGNDCTEDLCTAGAPSNPPLAVGTACSSDGGALCDAAGACVGCLTPDDCPGQDTECQSRTCTAGACGVSNAPQGTAVASQIAGDCRRDQCDGGGGVETVDDDGDVEDDGNECTDNTCSGGMNVTTSTAIDTPCGAGGALLCDGAGACVGCTDVAQCGTPGNECLIATCVAGACGTADKADGTSCDDGNACSQTDTCQAGACTGASPVVCAALDQCHDPGTCDPATGACSDPQKADGSTCNDGDGCTQTDTCQAGSCTGAEPVVCMALDQCHDPGTCSPATGACSNPEKADGSMCDDGDACSQADSCQAGTCTGADPVMCVALDQCHDVGACNPASGVCSNPEKADGSTCDDGNGCTQTDSCQAGMCTGGSPVVCAALDQCHDAGLCDPSTGACSNPEKADGSTCDDGDGCTQTDTCQGGMCTGASPVMCMPIDECHVAGLCDPASGACSNPTAMDGTSCMTGGMPGACQAGSCISVSCSDTMLNGTETDVDCGGGECPACGNGNACLGGSDCVSGHCVGNVCVECAAATDCPGVDTDCQARTCIANACGVAHVASGTPTSGQTAGDCVEEQCDGMGGFMSANDDLDTPVDGNQCTGDVCMDGVGSNPPLPASTPCDQNGGDVCDGSGSCVPGLMVADTTPADGAAGVATSSTISVTFTTAMTPATLTGQTSLGACSGTIQVSSNDFSQCIPFVSSMAEMSGANTTATLTPLGRLHAGTTYRVRVTTGAESALGVPLGATFTQVTGFRTVSGGDACDGNVVISQVYGAGGNSGATYTHDFVELHNIGATPVNLAGWSIQYASANGNTWNNLVALSGTVAPGGYFLVQLAGGANGVALPTPDLTGSINMAAGTGKVALVRGATQMATDICPDPARVLDFVGFGLVNCFEGTGPAAAPSTTNATFRGEAGCADTNANNSNFAAAPVAPRNSATPAAICNCNAVANELGTAAEADFCNIQFPASLSVQAGQPTELVYGRIFENGTTSTAGAQPNVIAQLGHGPPASNPTTSAAWQWTQAAFNVQEGNDDEYQQQVIAPAPGVYPYTYRFSFDGLQWTYCDLDGAGSNPGLEFSPALLGAMTVTP